MKQELPAGSKGAISEPTVYDAFESRKSLRRNYEALDFKLDHLTKEVIRIKRREGVPR